jgi:hypothetical protein
MPVNLKIIFSGSKRDIKPFLSPVIFELQPGKGGKPRRFVLESVEKQIEDGPRRRTCFFEIPKLQPGAYTLNVLNFRTGQPILQEPDLMLKGREVEYSFGSRYRPRYASSLEAGFKSKPGARSKGMAKPSAVRAPNTYAMDLIADAPYRLEKRYPYLPILIYFKDIHPEEVRVRSIELFSRSPADGDEYTMLPPDCIHAVWDSNATPIEENGKPSLLRFDAGKKYETIMTDPWSRVILLYKEKLPSLQGSYLNYRNVPYLHYKIKVKYRKVFDLEKQFIFRTLKSEQDLPRIEGWLYGDAHYHSDFTDNPIEYGGPLVMTAETARATGLSWVTVTDHSYCLSRPKTQEEEQQGNRWSSYKQAVQEVNGKFADVLLVPAEEITVRKHLMGLHLLSYGNPFVEDKHPAGFGSRTMEDVLDSLAGQPSDNGGFLFAAHPAAEEYAWKDRDLSVASDPKYRNLFCGLEIFNEKILYKGTSQLTSGSYVIDPFETLQGEEMQHLWSRDLEKGLRELWARKLLLPSLRTYEEEGVLRKYFVLAGSDAHMDFNYALRPQPPFLVHQLNDNAFGKVRTLAYLSGQGGQSLTESRLLQALRCGQTLLTDGPVALFHIRAEGEDRICRFGETLHLPRGRNLELLLEWRCTPEFGPISRLSLILGTRAGEREITGELDLSGLGYNGMEGTAKHVFKNWEDSPSYLRLEAAANIDLSTAESRCITNPIWIVVQ